MGMPRCSGALEAGTQAVSYRTPAAVPARSFPASALSPDVPHSLCGMFVTWTGCAAVRVRIHDVRVVREHGGRLQSRMSSARGARAARAALQQAVPRRAMVGQGELASLSYGTCCRSAARVRDDLGARRPSLALRISPVRAAHAPSGTYSHRGSW